MRRVVIFGAGGMGTALALLFGKAGPTYASGRAIPSMRPNSPALGSTRVICPGSGSRDA